MNLISTDIDNPITANNNIHSILETATINTIRLLQEQQKQDNKPSISSTGLTLEFLIFMIPCYIFVIASGYYWSKLSNEPTMNNVYIQSHISYFIKRAISYIIFIAYILTILLAFVLSNQEFWAADYKGYSLVYIFGAIAWFLSAKILEIEHEKNLAQKIYTHRLFWLTSFFIFTIKLFVIREFTLVIFPINVIKWMLCGILAIYAVYKPNDIGQNDNHYSFNMPLFAQNIITFVENCGLTKKYLGSSIMQNESLLQEKDVEEIIGTMSRTNAYVDNENDPQSIALRENLPRLGLKIIKIASNNSLDENEIKFYYILQVEITTKTGETNTKTIQKFFRQFLELETSVINHFRKINDPVLLKKVPTFEKIKIDDYSSETKFIQARIDILNSYLQSFINSPRFICKEVIDFLEIEDAYRLPFINYLKYLEKAGKNDKRKRFTPVNQELANIGSIQGNSNTNEYIPPKNIETRNENSLGGLKSEGTKEETIPTRRSNNILSKMPNPPSFIVKCDMFQKAPTGDRYEFLFTFTEKHTKETWKIKKSYTDFVTLHKSLELKFGNKFISFDKYNPKPESNIQTLQEDFLKKRKDGLENYLKVLLENTTYYDHILFQFIGYDFNEQKSASILDLSRSSLLGSLSLRSTLDSKSFYMHEGSEIPTDTWKKQFFVGVFKIDLNLFNSSIKIPAFKYLQPETKKKIIYEITLQEFDSIAKYQLKRQIIQHKKYKDFKILYLNVVRHYEKDTIIIPLLPEKTKNGMKRRPEDLKGSIEKWMNELIRLDGANECNPIIDFFYLNDIRSNYKTPIDVELYDFRDEYD